MGIHWKIRSLWGVPEKPICRGKLPKKGGSRGHYIYKLMSVYWEMGVFGTLSKI